MKMFRKTIALLAIISIMVSTTAFAAFSDITTDQTATEVKAGDTITITATFDTLANAKGFSMEFVFDNTAFSLDTADDTEFNFGSNKKPSYWPNYIVDSLKEEKLAGGDGYCPFFGGVWDTFNYNATETKVIYLATDTSGTVMTAEDEAEDMYPNRTLGVVFNVNDDIEAGDYTFTINTTVSDATVGDVTASKTVTVTVAGDEFVPETIKGATVEGDDANIVLEKDPATAYKNEYTNVAKFEATLGANVKYGEAGFIWVKDDVESANKFTVDASVIAGGGTFEYAVAMYAIPAGVDIDAIPYYITAE